MQTPTREQIEASHQLAEALLRFLVTLRLNAPTPIAPPTPRPVEVLPAKEPSPEKPLISAREAASLLAISERTLWALSAPRGPIPAIRLGRSVRYSVDALRAWMRNAERQPGRP